MHMKILIISIDHKMQYLEADDDAADLHQAKERLRVLIGEKLAAGPVGAICEESSPKKSTIAQSLAASADPPILWNDIHMSTKEREEAGIVEALTNRPSCPDLDDMSTSIEFRIPEDDIREEYFVKRIESVATPDRMVLVLLGDMHTEAVAKKLVARGHHVEYTQQLILRKKWAELPKETNAS